MLRSIVREVGAVVGKGAIIAKQFNDHYHLSNTLFELGERCVMRRAHMVKRYELRLFYCHLF